MQTNGFPFIYKSTANTYEFIAPIVHELRTPTNSISAIIQIIEPLLPTKDQKYIRNAQTSCNLLINIINDIMDISKLQQGKLTITNKVYDVLKIIKQASYLMSYSIEEKGLSFNISNKTTNTLHIEGDERRFMQVILNLLSNALKFTTHGKISIGVERIQDNLFINVEDTGIGIKEENKVKIFTPYTTIAGNEGNKDGTGLGLYVSKQLCQKMGGDLSFTSTYNIGTKFKISLYNAKFHESIGTEEECQIIRRRIKKPIPYKKRILLVDDNTFNLFAISNLFLKHGIECDTCTTGKGAIEKCEQLSLSKNPFYCALLLDIEMPVMNGYEVSASLNKLMHSGRLPTTPIIGISGNDRESILANCKLNGMIDCSNVLI